MDIEQGLNVMKGIGNMYKQMSEAPQIPSPQIMMLKHTLLELELVMISIRKHMEQLQQSNKKNNDEQNA